MSFVRAHVDVYCTWSKKPPRYRLYVERELMAERTWSWHNIYLEEMLQLELEPGDYTVKLELLDQKKASLHYQNLRIMHGPAEVINQQTIRVLA